jgi:hypothetical protein
VAFGSVDRRSIQLSYGRPAARVAIGGRPANLGGATEIGVYTFAELSPDPATGRSIRPHQRMRDVGEIELAEQVGLNVFGVGEPHRGP